VISCSLGQSCALCPTKHGSTPDQGPHLGKMLSQSVLTRSVLHLKGAPQALLVAQDVTKFRDDMRDYCNENANSKEAETRDATQKKHIMDYIETDVGYDEVDEACRRAMLDVVLL
jgi:hypothetical protein